MIKIVARHYRVQPARRASSEQIYERRVLNPDNNHLSGTIVCCINRVLSPDINDKRERERERRSLSLGPLDITAIVLSVTLSFVERTDQITSTSLLFFQTNIRQASNLSIDLSVRNKKSIPS